MTTTQVEKPYVIMVNGVMRRQRFQSLEEAVQYIRGMRDGGKSATLCRELPNCSLVR